MSKQKRQNTDEVLEKVGSVSILRRGSSPFLWVRYSMREDGKSRIIRKTTKTADLKEARAFALRIDKELVQAQGVPVAMDGLKPVTVKEAALSHPSSKRDKEVYPVQYRLYCSYVEQFCRYTNIWLLKSLTVESVMDWARHLQKQGYKPATVSHRLRYIRRAARMAPSHCLPDVLTGLQLIRADSWEEDVQTFTEEELVQIVRHLERLEDKRALCAVLIMGLMGLRPSEVIRLRVCDAQDGVLRVGVRERKNRASRRDLPMPATVQEQVEALCSARPEDSPLIESGHHGRRNKPWVITSLNHYLNPKVEEAIGRKLSCKHFRKTFATLAIGPMDLEARKVESYLGHAFALMAAVSNRHYLAKQTLKELKPAADVIEAWWSEVYQKFTTGNGVRPSGGTPTRDPNSAICLDSTALSRPTKGA